MQRIASPRRLEPLSAVIHISRKRSHTAVNTHAATKLHKLPRSIASIVGIGMRQRWLHSIADAIFSLVSDGAIACPWPDEQRILHVSPLTRTLVYCTLASTKGKIALCAVLPIFYEDKRKPLAASRAWSRSYAALCD